MQNVSLGKKRSFQKGSAMLALILGLLTAPLSASASTFVPTQVLPPVSEKYCAPVAASEVFVHIYDGNLDSFDITIADQSYVAVSTVVGETPIPFSYISRWANTDGSVRMHVDLQSVRMDKDVRVEITFLSAHADSSGNPVTCIFKVPARIPAQQGVVTVGSTGEQVPGQTPSNHVPPPRPQPSSSGTGQTSGSTTVSSSTSNPGIVAAMSSLGNLCVDGGATRLWIVLLVLFALFTFTLSAQRFEAGSSVRDWNIGLILAVFAGLLIFWYVSAVCRTGPWAPALATLITIVGLLYSMLKSDDSNEILLLKDGKK